MILKLNTVYKNQEKHGNAIACLNLYLETANIDLRDRVAAAIKSALAGVEGTSKPAGKMGFSSED